MADRSNVTVTCYPQPNGSKRGSDSIPVERAIVRDPTTGQEWEYRVPPHLAYFDRDDIKERVLNWWEGDVDGVDAIKQMKKEMGKVAYGD